MAGEERVTKLKIDNVKKIYQTRKGEMTALNGVNLDIKENEFICVVGPSGCGKSTLLNIIAGLDTPTSGAVYIDGKKIEGTGTERGVVFQQYALFPWLTVLKNVMFGLKLQGKSDAEAKEIAMKYIKMVQLEDFVNHYPKELSGGMKQRVMIAIALVGSPSIVIADEPTTSLDVTIEAQILDVLKNLQKTLGTSIILITHDLGVVAEMCTRVVVMYAGRIVEEAPVQELFADPKHPYTQGLLRSMPRVDAESYERLIPIEGTPVDMLNPPEGCPFAPRCEHCMKICLKKMPPYVEVGEKHRSACWLRVQELMNKEEK